MPANLDEVRRAFSVATKPGTVDGNDSGGDAGGRGNASDGDGTSVVGAARAVSNDDGGPRTVEPAAAGRKPDTGKRARTGDGSAVGDAAVARTGKRAASKTDPTSNIERLLFTIHFMLAAKTDVSALAMPQQDAHELAVAISELNALYGGKGGLLGPKGYAWLNLFIALGGTYLPMAVNSAREVKKRKPAKPHVITEHIPARS